MAPYTSNHHIALVFTESQQFPILLLFSPVILTIFRNIGQKLWRAFIIFEDVENVIFRIWEQQQQKASFHHVIICTTRFIPTHHIEPMFVTLPCCQLQCHLRIKS